MLENRRIQKLPPTVERSTCFELTFNWLAIEEDILKQTTNQRIELYGDLLWFESKGLGLPCRLSLCTLWPVANFIIF